MKFYTCPVQIEQVADFWKAYVPELLDEGASCSGQTPDEAVRNLRVVMQRVLIRLKDEGKKPPASVKLSKKPVLAVHV